MMPNNAECDACHYDRCSLHTREAGSTNIPCREGVTSTNRNAPVQNYGDSNTGRVEQRTETIDSFIGMFKILVFDDYSVSMHAKGLSHTPKSSRAINGDGNMPRAIKEAKREMLAAVEELVGAMKDERKEAEDIARFLHNNYELLAEKNGWNTQLQTRTSFDNLPVANRKTMNQVSRMVRKYVLEQLEKELAKLKESLG